MNLGLWVIIMAIVSCGIACLATRLRWTAWETCGVLFLAFIVSLRLLSGGSSDIKPNPPKETKALHERTENNATPLHHTNVYYEVIRFYIDRWIGNNPTKEEE